GGPPAELTLTRVQRTEDGPAAGGGHLAGAQARALRAAAGSWSVTTPPLAAGRRYSYRFRGVDRRGVTRTSRWFHVTAARWSDSGGKLLVRGRDRVVPGSVRWLADGDGPLRVRFALELAPGAHVVGFGERFDAVDQAGRTLDAVVFEQYKSQGAHGRTYLPMPFALVLEPGAVWGFRIDTSRRTWYDVGASEPGRILV